MTELGIIGVGAMGESLLAGWLKSGWSPDEILVCDTSDVQLAEIADRYGVEEAKISRIAKVKILFLAVKPSQLPKVLLDISANLNPSTLVVSIASGISLKMIEKALPEDTPVIRVMPNTPALVGKAMSGISPGKAVRADHVQDVEKLLRAVGETIIIDESKMDALTAVSGSGPAYLFYVAEAMIEAGVHLGLTREISTKLVNQTLLGAAAMLKESDISATVLREKVTSPAGTTAAALETLDERSVRAAFLKAMRNSAQRSKDMGK